MSKKCAYLYIMAGAVLWGFIGVFFKGLSAIGFTSMQVVAIRVTVSAAMMVLYLLVTDRKLLKVSLRDCGWFVGTGIFSLVFFNWCYFTAIELSSLSVAVVLLYTAPVFVMLLSAVLFKERLTLRKLCALGMTLAGCVFVTELLQSDRSISLLGILFGLGSGIGYALYSIFGKFALRNYAPATVSAYTFLFATLAAIPLARFGENAALLFHPKTALYALGIGVLCCMLPFVFYTKGLSAAEPSQASILATLEPVVATLLGVCWFGEPMTLPKLLGILLIFGAILVLNTRTKQA